MYILGWVRKRSVKKSAATGQELFPMLNKKISLIRNFIKMDKILYICFFFGSPMRSSCIPFYCLTVSCTVFAKRKLTLAKIRTIRYRLSFALIVSCMQINVRMCGWVRAYVSVSNVFANCREILITTKVKQAEFEGYKCCATFRIIVHTVCGFSISIKIGCPHSWHPPQWTYYTISSLFATNGVKNWIYTIRIV